METSIRAGALLVLGAVFVAVLAGGQLPPEGPPFVPGQVIVKLSPESAGGRSLALTDHKNLQTDTGLARYLSALSKQVAVPLRIERLSSGGELVLAIELELFRCEFLARLRSDPSVESVLERKVSPKDAIVEVGFETLVQFKAGSDAAATVKNLYVKVLETSPECQTLARDLVGDLDFQPEVRITGDSELVLGVDLRLLTKDLVERLRGHSDVEYAQLNILLQTFG